MHRKLLILLFIFFYYLNGFSQSQNDLRTIFWQAVKESDYQTITSIGAIIENDYNESTQRLDSTMADIMLYTALGYSEMGQESKSLHLYLKVLKLMNRDWETKGKKHSDVNYEVAYLYLEQEDFVHAIEYYSQAYIIYKKL